MHPFSYLLLSFVPHTQADGDCSGDSHTDELVGDLQSALPPPPVYYGTSKPTYVPLTEGQMLAIGTWGNCSGTIIASRWVLTANHCNVRKGDEFCVGEDPADPDQCFEAVFVERNPDADMTIAMLDRDATEAVPGLEPIPLLTEKLDDSWLGKMSEAAGYGQQEDGGYGEREFTAEPIVDLDGHEMTIDGERVHGVCFGDSGGPVMVIDSQGTVRVAGALSWGDPDCLGKDRYTRVDTNLEWLEAFTGPTDAEEGATSDGDATEGDDGSTTAEEEPVEEEVAEEEAAEEEEEDWTTSEGWWRPLRWRWRRR